LKFDKLAYSPLFEKTLVRFISEFNSEMNPTRVLSELSKTLNKKVSKDPVSSYNMNLSRGDDGVFKIESGFMTYRDSRLLILSLFKWIERNGSTDKRTNFIVDIKFIDSTPGPFKGTLFNNGITIDRIDKLKMILDFNESRVYDSFPTRRYGFISKSINRFEPNQKFIPKEDSPVDPKFYSIPNTSECGINFETLTNGFLRLQYIGGEDYNKKAQDVLDIISEFCVSAWNCTVNPGYSKDNITSFEKIVSRHTKVREAYIDYKVFKQNYPKIILTVDLLDNSKIVDSYYANIRDRIYDILTNIEYKGDIEINYDTGLGVIQIKGGKLKCNVIKNVEFIECEIEFGNYYNCDFYNSKIKDAVFKNCNLFLDSIAERCKLIDSFANRTIELNNCEIEGENGMMNCKMSGGIFRNGSIGMHAEISNDAVVIEYKKVKVGYMVAGDKILIPTKKFDRI